MVIDDYYSYIVYDGLLSPRGSPYSGLNAELEEAAVHLLARSGSNEKGFQIFFKGPVTGHQV